MLERAKNRIRQQKAIGEQLNTTAMERSDIGNVEVAGPIKVSLCHRSVTEKMVRVILIQPDQRYQRLGLGLGIRLGLGLGLGPNFQGPDHFSHRKIGPAGPNPPPDQNFRDRSTRTNTRYPVYVIDCECQALYNTEGLNGPKI